MELYYPLLSTVPQLQASDIGQEYSQALDRPSDKEISKKKMLVRLQSHRMLPYTTKKMNFTYCRIFSFWGVGGRGGGYISNYSHGILNLPFLKIYITGYMKEYSQLLFETMMNVDGCGWMKGG